MRRQWPEREIDVSLDRTEELWWDELVSGIRSSLTAVFPSVKVSWKGIWNR